MMHWMRLLSAVALLGLSACGGGGGESGSTPLGGGSGTAKAEDLALVLSAPSLTNGGTTTITATVTAVDKNRNVVAGIPVTISADANATVAPSATSTNSSGVVTAAIGVGADRTNRVVTVTAVSGTLSRTASFAVTGAKLTASASPMVVAGSANNVIEYTLVDFNAIAMVNQDITVTAPGLATETKKTDINGKFRYVYTAPSAPGTLEVVATAAGAQYTQSVTISSASTGVAPASEFPQSASITPTPSVVTVNSPGSTTNQVELRALFVGANNKPVPRVRVRFDLAGNANNTDGEITLVGSYAYSDDNGVARATFIPKLRSSPTNGVTVRACYDTFDFATPSPTDCTGASNTVTATLTVSAEALAVSIGTNNLVEVGEQKLTYKKSYIVMVVDAAGQAKSDVQITPSVDLNGYYKGTYVWNGRFWAQVGTLDSSQRYRWTGTAWDLDATAGAELICPNEDVNRNGVREAPTFVAASAPPDLSARQEDLNFNGSLDPRKSDVAITMVGSSRTDASGRAVVQIEYPRSHATWINFTITVTASGISGTEARARFTGVLPGLADDVTSETVPPPFLNSPYGTGTVCTDTR